MDKPNNLTILEEMGRFYTHELKHHPEGVDLDNLADCTVYYINDLWGRREADQDSTVLKLISALAFFGASKVTGTEFSFVTQVGEGYNYHG